MPSSRSTELKRATPLVSAPMLRTLPDAAEDPQLLCPDLGDYVVVEDLIREYFFGGILERAVALGECQLTRQTAGDGHVAACCYLARVFGGQVSEDFTSRGRWHEGNGRGTLAARVRRRLRGKVAVQHLQQKDSALQSLFALAALDMFAAIERFNATGDAQPLYERMLECSEDLTRLLLGLPRNA